MPEAVRFIRRNIMRSSALREIHAHYPPTVDVVVADENRTFGENLGLTDAHENRYTTVDELKMMKYIF